MLVGVPWVSTANECQPAAPSVGALEYTKFPELSTAAQNFVEGQDTATKYAPESITACDHPLPDPPGVIEYEMLPEPGMSPIAPTATQSSVAGQDTPRNPPATVT